MMMKKYDKSVEINHNLNWHYVPDHHCRILIIGDSGSETTNVLLNLIKNQRLDMDTIYLYVKDPFESNYQMLINGREKAGITKVKKSKRFDDVCESLEDYNPTKNRRVLMVFDDMIADMESNKSYCY